MEKTRLTVIRASQLIFIFSIVLLALTIMPAVSKAQAAEGYAFDTKWGGFGAGDGQFHFPAGVDVDSSGNVYVADQFNHRVQKFSSDGTFITKWGSEGTGDGQFGNPFGVAVDSSGNVYVVDSVNDRVQKFTSTGTFITKWGSTGTGDGQFDIPAGVAVDSAGNVYVADAGSSDRIQKFDSTGTFITKWGGTGSGDGQLLNPNDIAVDSSGNVFVADSSNDRVQKFSSTGTFITKWGSTGTGEGQFDGPIGIAVDSSGNVFVAECCNDRVQKFTSTGTFLTKWGSSGTGDGKFDNPAGVAVDSLGSVYVADTFNNRIQKFVSDTTPPVVTYTGPAGFTADNSPTITGTATDDGEIVSVTLSLNGGAETPCTIGGTGNVNCPTADLPDGFYAATISATDAADNMGSDGGSFIVVFSLFQAKWDALGGAPGDPLGDVFEIPGGLARDYEVGRLIYNEAAGAVHWLHGPILEKYDEIGAYTSPLRLPVSDVFEYKVSGQTAWARATFQGGWIYWTPSGGAKWYRNATSYMNNW